MTVLSGTRIVPKDLIKNAVPFKSLKIDRYVEMTRIYRSVSSHATIFGIPV